MAHKYNNFDDAFADLCSNLPLIKECRDYGYVNKNAARAHWSSNQDHLAIDDIIFCLENLLAFISTLVYYRGNTTDTSEFYESIYWAAHNVTPVPLTMLELIAAMSIAMPDEIMTFICLTDAYHASLWDRPYNPEYFATMVRAFKSWG